MFIIAWLVRLIGGFVIGRALGCLGFALGVLILIYVVPAVAAVIAVLFLVFALARLVRKGLWRRSSERRQSAQELLARMDESMRRQKVAVGDWARGVWERRIEYELNDSRVKAALSSATLRRVRQLKPPYRVLLAAEGRTQWPHRSAKFSPDQNWSAGDSAAPVDRAAFRALIKAVPASERPPHWPWAILVTRSSLDYRQTDAMKEAAQAYERDYLKLREHDPKFIQWMLKKGALEQRDDAVSASKPAGPDRVISPSPVADPDRDELKPGVDPIDEAQEPDENEEAERSPADDHEERPSSLAPEPAIRGKDGLFRCPHCVAVTGSSFQRCHKCGAPIS